MKVKFAFYLDLEMIWRSYQSKLGFLTTTAEPQADLHVCMSPNQVLIPLKWTNFLFNFKLLFLFKHPLLLILFNILTFEDTEFGILPTLVSLSKMFTFSLFF